MIINRMAGGGAAGGLPNFTYSGTSTMLDDGDGNWRIKFLTSGTLVFRSSPSAIDVFLVGGGGNGSVYYNNTASWQSGAGGGGGYTFTSLIPSVDRNTEYQIVIGGSGGASSAFGLSANGGANASGYNGGNGGSGGGAGTIVSGSVATNGYGGQNGGNGTSGHSGFNAGQGQGSTTKEFGEADGTLYSAGGCALNVSNGSNISGYNTVSGKNGVANTGGGGGGVQTGTAGLGGSGIVIIRNHRAA